MLPIMMERRRESPTKTAQATPKACTSPSQCPAASAVRAEPRLQPRTTSGGVYGESEIWESQRGARLGSAHCERKQAAGRPQVRRETRDSAPVSKLTKALPLHRE